MNIEDRSRGNWAFIRLREGYTLLLEYEKSHLIDKGDIPKEESGPRLYMACVCIEEALRDRQYLVEWVQQRLSEECAECFGFFGYEWRGRADVEQTLFDISQRVFCHLASNFKELLGIRQSDNDAQPLVLAKIRNALKIEGKALNSHSDPPGREVNFLATVIGMLIFAYTSGERKGNALKKGVLTKCRNDKAPAFGYTDNQAEKIWNRNKDWLHGRIVKAPNHELFMLWLDGRKVSFIPPNEDSLKDVCIVDCTLPALGKITDI